MENWCCRKNSTQQEAGPPGLRLSNPEERERNADGQKSGVQYVAVFVRSPTPSHTQPFQIKWKVYFSKNCVARLYCVVVMMHAIHMYMCLYCWSWWWLCNNMFIIKRIKQCPYITRRCPWCNGYRRRKWTRRHEFKSWTRLIAFHIALIPLGKVWIQLFSLQLWVK